MSCIANWGIAENECQGAPKDTIRLCGQLDVVDDNERRKALLLDLVREREQKQIDLLVRLVGQRQPPGIRDHGCRDKLRHGCLAFEYATRQ
jgi:hypothetical protein